ncbi:unnamed protein product, partial [Didymodactylos carnosus]
MERGRNLKRAHYISNVSNALEFLASRKIKLVNIRPADIVDGKPIILGLVWMLILCYQIEESTLFTDDGSAGGTRGKAKEVLLEWARKKTTGIPSSETSSR